MPFDWLQALTAGKVVPFQGADWFLVQNTGLQTKDGHALYLAVRAEDSFPAPLHLIHVETPSFNPGEPDDTTGPVHS